MHDNPSHRFYMGIVLAIAVSGMIVIVWSTSTFGPGIGPDSVGYLSAGQNLAAGNGLNMFDGAPLIDWPPLLPFIVAAVDTLGISPVQFIRFLNALLFGLMIFMYGRLLLKYLKSEVIAVIATLFVACSIPLLRFSLFVLSDLLFAALTFFFLFELKRYTRHRRTSALWLAALYAAAADFRLRSGDLDGEQLARISSLRSLIWERRRDGETR